MIEVLRDWSDIGRATGDLRRQGLPGHGLPEKNWDLAMLRRAVDPLPRDAPIVDLGCGGLHGLRFMSALGFTDLIGIDLTVTPYERAVQMRGMMRLGRLPYRLRQRSLYATGLPAASAAALVALSVIEHGVDPDRFFAECARLLRPGGLLFVSTDYWPEPVPDGPALFGLPWTILDRPAVDTLITAARSCSLGLVRDDAVPDAAERTVVWAGREYTFIAMLFRAGG
jgi:SAM-dependent methyltransferase